MKVHELIDLLRDCNKNAEVRFGYRFGVTNHQTGETELHSMYGDACCFADYRNVVYIGGHKSITSKNVKERKFGMLPDDISQEFGWS